MKSLASCVFLYIRISCIVRRWSARPWGLPLGLPIWLLLPPSLSPSLFSSLSPSLSPSLSLSLSLFLTSCVLCIIRVGKGDGEGEGVCKVKVGERLRRLLRGRFKEAV